MSKRGGSRPGAGRPAGSKDKAKQAAEQRVEELMDGVPDCDSIDPKVRLEAVLKAMPGWSPLVLEVCRALMPYVHSKRIEQTTIIQSEHDRWLKERLEKHPGVSVGTVTQVH